MAFANKYRYPVAFTAYLDEREREDCLAYAQHLFAGAEKLSPGRLVTHLLEMRGRRGITEAREWVEGTRYETNPMHGKHAARDQGGALDDKG